MMDRLMELWGKLPTTQVRVSVTLACVVWTTGHYMVAETWKPSTEWLAFLLCMSGVDAAQFLVKRTTDHAYVAAKKP